MLILAVVAFLACVADVAALVYVTRRPPAGPTPLPAPVPLPELYAGRHRAIVLIGGSR